MADRNLHETVQFLKKTKDKDKLSDEQVANKAGVDRMTIKNLFEEAQKLGPYYNTVVAVSKGLGYELSHVLVKDDTASVNLEPDEIERLRKIRTLSAESLKNLDYILDCCHEKEYNSKNNE